MLRSQLIRSAGRLPVAYRTQTRLFSVVGRQQNKSPIEVAKDALKSVDRAVSDAAVKGIDTGEQLAESTKKVVSDATGSVAAKTSGAHGTAAGAADQAAGKAQGTVDQLSGKASELAGEAKGKAAELTGQAKGKASEVKGKVEGEVNKL